MMARELSYGSEPAAPVDPDCDTDSELVDPPGDDPPTVEVAAVEEEGAELFGVELGVTLEPAEHAATDSPPIRKRAKSRRLAGLLMLSPIGVPFVVIDRIGRSLHRATGLTLQLTGRVGDDTGHHRFPSPNR